MAAVAQWDQRSFGGSPYVTISAISTAGGIVSNRTTGQTPFFVQASASAITATGTSLPYQDLEFTWTLEVEDGAGGWEAITDSEGLTDPISDEAVNPYTDQEGPEFVAVIRDEHLVGAAQTDYRLTLNIRGQNGGSYTTASTTETFTVDPWTGTTYYIDPVSGDNGNDGLSSGAPKADETGLLADDVKLLIKSGTTLPCTLFLSNVDGIRFDVYGGSTPYTLQSDSSTAMLRYLFNSVTYTPADHVFSNAILDGNDSCNYVVQSIGTSSCTMDNVFFDNCTITNDGVTNNESLCTIGGSNTTINGIGWWNCTFTGTNTERFGLYGAQTSPDWAFVVAGGPFTGGGSNATLDHHIYWNLGEHSLFKYIQFSTSDIHNFCMNMNKPDDVSTDHQYCCITHCDFNGDGGPTRAIDFSNGAGNQSASPIANVVMQDCVFRNFTERAVAPQTWEGTIRDFVSWGCEKEVIVNNDTNNPSQVYHGHIYKASGTGSGVIQYTSGNSSAFRVSHLKIQHDATAVLFQKQDTTDTGSATIDYSQYYAPNDSDGDIFSDWNNSVEVTFTEWQGLGYDTNGSNGDDFGWLDPANGDFRSAAAGSSNLLLLGVG